MTINPLKILFAPFEFAVGALSTLTLAVVVTLVTVIGWPFRALVRRHKRVKRVKRVRTRTAGSRTCRYLVKADADDPGHVACRSIAVWRYPDGSWEPQNVNMRRQLLADADEVLADGDEAVPTPAPLNTDINDIANLTMKDWPALFATSDRTVVIPEGVAGVPGFGVSTTCATQSLPATGVFESQQGDDPRTGEDGAAIEAQAGVPEIALSAGMFGTKDNYLFLKTPVDLAPGTQLANSQTSEIMVIVQKRHNPERECVRDYTVRRGETIDGRIPTDARIWVVPDPKAKATPQRLTTGEPSAELLRFDSKVSIVSDSVWRAVGYRHRRRIKITGVLVRGCLDENWCIGAHWADDVEGSLNLPRGTIIERVNGETKPKPEPGNTDPKERPSGRLARVTDANGCLDDLHFAQDPGFRVNDVLGVPITGEQMSVTSQWPSLKYKDLFAVVVNRGVGGTTKGELAKGTRIVLLRRESELPTSG